MANPVDVLFGFDETLVHSGGSGRAAWKAAFDKLHRIRVGHRRAQLRARSFTGSDQRWKAVVTRPWWGRGLSRPSR